MNPKAKEVLSWAWQAILIVSMGEMLMASYVSQTTPMKEGIGTFAVLILFTITLNILLFLLAIGGLIYHRGDTPKPLLLAHTAFLTVGFLFSGYFWVYVLRLFA